jgi:hypothetical protein
MEEVKPARKVKKSLPTVQNPKGVEDSARKSTGSKKEKEQDVVVVQPKRPAQKKTVDESQAPPSKSKADEPPRVERKQKGGQALVQEAPAGKKEAGPSGNRKGNPVQVQVEQPSVVRSARIPSKGDTEEPVRSPRGKQIADPRRKPAAPEDSQTVDRTRAKSPHAKVETVQPPIPEIAKPTRSKSVNPKLSPIEQTPVPPVKGSKGKREPELLATAPAQQIRNKSPRAIEPEGTVEAVPVKQPQSKSPLITQNVAKPPSSKPQQAKPAPLPSPVPDKSPTKATATTPFPSPRSKKHAQTVPY